ncbi:hypothetical protein [Allomuricauda sp. R78024]|uniref:hypothetical protein n=1 Tax=Allomuricauda sp. R78024 TaxID=3093867 RepID=UPI0037CA4FA7
MKLETDTFIKYFSENRNEYSDPKINQEDGVITLVSKGFDKMNLIGNLFIVIFVPIIIIIVIANKQLPTSTSSFLIAIAIIWFIVTLYKRIQKIVANNNIIIDVENQNITIVPQDYFRKNILKIDSRNFSFNSIRGIKTKIRNYDKFNSGLRLVLSHKNKEITLVDIWTKQLGAKLNQFIQKVVSTKL